MLIYGENIGLSINQCHPVLQPFFANPKLCCLCTTKFYGWHIGPIYRFFFVFVFFYKYWISVSVKIILVRPTKKCWVSDIGWSKNIEYRLETTDIMDMPSLLNLFKNVGHIQYTNAHDPFQ